MIKENFIHGLDSRLKGLIFLFVITLSIGFYTGINFVRFTSSASPTGIEENYLGNEDNEESDVMKFKKSKHEMLNILHTHFLSMSLIFFILGMLVYGTKLPARLKTFLLYEPLVSVILTFGGIYFLWKGVLWMSYLIMVSGFLMTISYTVSILAILYAVFSKRKD